MEQQKATPVRPPVHEPEIVDVDMTNVYTALGLLTFTASALGISTVLLWRKTRRNEEYLEAMREYVSRLVNETQCGHTAYRTLIDEIEEDDEPPVDWSEDHSPYPMQHEMEEY